LSQVRALTTHHTDKIILSNQSQLISQTIIEFLQIKPQLKKVDKIEGFSKSQGNWEYPS
jgi:hypothetical protein